MVSKQAGECRSSTSYLIVQTPLASGAPSIVTAAYFKTCWNPCVILKNLFGCWYVVCENSPNDYPEVNNSLVHCSWLLLLLLFFFQVIAEGKTKLASVPTGGAAMAGAAAGGGGAPAAAGETKEEEKKEEKKEEEEEESDDDMGFGLFD